MPIAATSSSGATAMSATVAHATSNRRLAMAQSPANGHEDFGGVEAVLIAPRPGAVPQGLERARVRVGPHLTRVTGHRGQFAFEGRGDVDPGIRAERARESPLRAARGVERVDRLDAARGGPRRDQGGLEHALVVLVDVTTVLAVDDRRVDRK